MYQLEAVLVNVFGLHGRGTAAMSAFVRNLNGGNGNGESPGCMLANVLVLLMCTNPDSWIHLVVTSVATLPNYAQELVTL